jgi:uncharacterized protein
MIRMMYSHFIIILLLLFLNSTPLNSQPDKKDKVPPKIKNAVQLFDMKDINLLDGPFKKGLEQNHDYLLNLDINSLLHNFRINAGFPSHAIPLKGWEAPDIELRGHFTGHFLSACALIYSSTNDKRFIKKADSVIIELEKCQNALGKTGYLSAFPESFIDRVETGNRVWAPYYTLHKIFTGLIDAYIYLDNTKALEIAEKMAAWVKSRTDKLSDEQIQKMLRTEYGGMNDMFYNLYGLTGNKTYIEMAKRFEQKSFFEPLSEHQDKLKGLHVNTQIPKVIGSARGYELTGDEYYKTIATFFWNQVTNARAYSTGGTSHYEYFRSEPYHLSDQLSANDHENCCTYNMLKLTSHLFQWTADAHYADYYEKALFNGIMGTQHPKAGGAFMYYVPMKPGLFRYYCEPESSFVCCSGTGIESFSKFNDNIYFHNNDELVINLFIASELKWTEKGITLIQETKFPEEEKTTFKLKIKNPVNFSFNIRIPYWIQKGYTIKINDKIIEASSSPGSYFKIVRTWKNNDKIEITLPMSLHLWKMPDNPKRISIMYGPLVLAGALGDKGMDESMKFGMYGDAYLMNSEGAAIEIPSFITDESDPDKWIKPIKGKPLTFKTEGVGKPEDVTLIPFYKLYGERYSVYWDIFTIKEWGERKTPMPDNLLDKWVTGDKISDDSHNFQAYYIEKGDTLGKKWVKSKSWFRFDINIFPDKPNTLRVTYYGNESESMFNLFIDGIKINTPALLKHENGFYSIDYDLPVEQTKGKDRIAISYKVPERKSDVSVGATTVQKEQSRYETPKVFGAEIIKK